MAEKTVTKNGPKITTGNVAELPDYQPGVMSYSDSIGGADTVVGFDLAKDELADALVGVPFMITRVVFTPGVGSAGVKVSCEAVVGDEQALRRRRVVLSELPWEPEAQIVFNDGSTGIYRQIVQYLAARDYVKLNESDKPEGGATGESRYDIPPRDFAEIYAGEYETDDRGDFARYALNVRLVCPRGLRISEYDWNGNKSKTRYLG